MIRGAAFAAADDPGPTEQSVPSFAVFDAAVGWRFSDALELSVLGRNLFDRSYFASADEDAVLAPGRSFLLSIRGTFGE
jgi:outer membrane receptor protein involved in Fe transport